MNDFHLDSASYGTFWASGLSISYSFYKQELTDAVSKIPTHENSNAQTEININHLTNEIWNKLTDRDKEVFLTRLHEDNHYSLFISTPIGILLWRCFQVIKIGIMYVCHQLEPMPVGSLSFSQSIVDWYYEKGRSIFVEEVNKENVLTYKKDKIIDPRYKTYYINKMDDVIREISLTKRFIDILFSNKIPSNFTNKDFVSLANEVYYYLGIRCDFPFKAKWDTRSPNAPFAPGFNWSLSIIELFEGHARADELFIFEHCQASAAEWETWKSKIDNKYKKAFKLLIEECQLSASFAQKLIELSFDSPIDISCQRVTDEIIWMEDVLPCHRLANILKALYSDKLKEKPSNQSDFDFILQSAGLRTLSETYFPILSGGILGPEANWDGNSDSIINETTSSEEERLFRKTRAEFSAPYYQILLKKFDIAIKKRLIKYSDIYIPAEFDTISPSPDVIFFADVAHFNHNYFDLDFDSRFAISISHWFEFVMNIVALKLIANEKYIGQLELMLKIYYKRLMDFENPGQETIKNITSLEYIIKSTFGKMGINSLNI